MNRSIAVGIYGAAGYAGQDLVTILARHQGADIRFATSNSFGGQPVAETNLHYIAHEDTPLDDVDVVFLALPHKASAPVAKRVYSAGKCVIDLSADLRFSHPHTYSQWYGIEHPHPELLPVPYGLPELNRAAIRGANMVGVPGCYPTATILGLYPLLKANALSANMPIIVDAKSGVSGAGRSATPTTHFVNVYGDVIPYKAGRVHRHVGEIEQAIQQYTETAPTVIFTPHLIPVDRGLMASIYVTLNNDFTSDDVFDLYQSSYADEPLVRVLPLGQQASLKHIQRTNGCDVSITPVTDRYVHITSTIDNLRKGAASQAVQCFNLMTGFAETDGLL